MTTGICVTLKRNEQEAYVHRRARELAATGRFSGWAGIVFQLGYFEGFPLANTWLNYSSMVEELNGACQTARMVSRPKRKHYNEQSPSHIEKQR
jgi:hypothetical protein